MVGTFPAEERAGRAIDIIETLRLIICQRLVPTVDGKQTALQEFLVFNENIRENLLDSDPNKVTSVTRGLLNEHGQTMFSDAKKKFEDGIIPEREYKIIAAAAKRLEK